MWTYASELKPVWNFTSFYKVPNSFVTMEVIYFSDREAECCSTHLIDGDGTFNAAGLDNFIKQVKLAECGLSYAVVAIMGPQSSGMNSKTRSFLFFFWKLLAVL